jgi:hypothetical protein
MGYSYRPIDGGLGLRGRTVAVPATAPLAAERA